jgi:hypothetical protein
MIALVKVSKEVVNRLDNISRLPRINHCWGKRVIGLRLVAP